MAKARPTRRRPTADRRELQRPGRQYVIRRRTSPTFGRWRPGWTPASMTPRHLPMARRDGPHGPPRDPDRVTGSADRHRSRRASARRTATIADPAPGHSLALIRRVVSNDAITEDSRRPRSPPPLGHRTPIEAAPDPPPGAASSFPSALGLGGPSPVYVIRRRRRTVVGRWLARPPRRTVRSDERQLKNNRRTTEERCSTMRPDPSATRPVRSFGVRVTRGGDAPRPRPARAAPGSPRTVGGTPASAG